jgi:hypothetical protein
MTRRPSLPILVATAALGLAGCGNTATVEFVQTEISQQLHAQLTAELRRNPELVLKAVNFGQVVCPAHARIATGSHFACIAYGEALDGGDQYTYDIAVTVTNRSGAISFLLEPRAQ